MYESSGTLIYSSNNRLVVSVSQELADYYRFLLPKSWGASRQRYSAHITVVRCYKETPTNFEKWGAYQGEKVQFFYEPIVYYGEVYLWLNVFSTRLEQIREELGLPLHSVYTQPPSGFRKCFHMTIGNMKNS